jgi:phosphoribosylamine-glycine ligase
MKRKILILGAGHYQMPLIKQANILGYETIVCSIPGNYPGLKYADKIYDVSTVDQEGCLRVAQKEMVDGICVCGTDIVLPTIGRISDELGLIGPSYKSSMLSSNKALMKQAFLKHGVRTAKFFKVSSLQECIEKSQELVFPILLKIVDSSGSKGIKIVKNKKDITHAYNSIIELTNEKYIVIEEFIEGIEFGAQAFVHNGQFTFIMPHGDYVHQADTGIPIGHFAPYELSSEVLNDIEYQLTKSIQSLEIDNAAINADFILHNNKVYVLEIGARAGATCLPELVSVYYGINYYEYLLRMALNQTTAFKSLKHTPCVVELLIPEKSGRIQSIEMPELSNSILEFSLMCKVGDEVHEFRSGFDRIGHIVAKGDSVSSAQAEINRVKEKLIIQID